MSCEFVPMQRYVMVGWGCCQCRSYNGLQRKVCKRCGHAPCITLPQPSEFNLCDECGIPLSEGYTTMDGGALEHTPDCSKRKLFHSQGNLGPQAI